jgi:hypothetical protein
MLTIGPGYKKRARRFSDWRKMSNVHVIRLCPRKDSQSDLPLKHQALGWLSRGLSIALYLWTSPAGYIDDELGGSRGVCVVRHQASPSAIAFKRS